MKSDKFDAVVSIGRGGMVPARLLAEKFDIHTAYVIDVKAYNADNTIGEVKLESLKMKDDIKSVLIVDDVIFTGTTAKAAFDDLVKVNGNLSYAKFAFLYKNSALEQYDIDYEFAEAYDGTAKWLVFPWENE